MWNAFGTGILALGMAAGLAAAAPRAEAAAYLTAGEWYGALDGAVARYGEVSLSRLPSYAVEYQDGFGTWRPGEPSTVTVGTAGYPYTDPTQVRGRGWTTWPGDTAPALTAQFACETFTYGCLGALRVTFTFPYEIIGFAGQLRLTGDTLYLNDRFLPELQAGGYLRDEGYKPGNATFYGRLLDQPSSVFTLSWVGGGFPGLDATTVVSLLDATVVRAGAAGLATAVPEPASLALFGMGLAGLAATARRRRG